MLQTDTYYRGYRLSSTSEGGVHIWHDADLIDTKDRESDARSQIDEWLNAK